MIPQRNISLIANDLAVESGRWLIIYTDHSALRLAYGFRIEDADQPRVKIQSKFTTI